MKDKGYQNAMLYISLISYPIYGTQKNALQTLHLPRAVYARFYSNKVKVKQEKQVTHTCYLIEDKRFMEAQNETYKEKIDLSDDKLKRSFSVYSFLFAFHLK